MHISVRFVVSELWCDHLGAAGLVVGGGRQGLERVWPRCRSRGRRGGQLDRWLVQVLEADALDVANIGRAVTAGAEIW